MATFRQGKISEVLETTRAIQRVKIDLDGGAIEAVCYPALTGPLRVGDHVVVNTTGIDLALGTGGVGFVLWNLDGAGPDSSGEGHIMKLRYTPWQTNVLAAEAPESPHHKGMLEAVELGGTPVVACGLHSQLPAAVAGIRTQAPNAKIGYLMTDGGALPLAFSRMVPRLRDAGLIDVTCTSGHAFGGDLESVNVFGGLLALRHAAGCDAIVVAMGPGSVGTGTPFGYSALEQGQALDAVSALGGLAVAALRISFHDSRERHRGVSHHSLTALRVAARESCTIAVPKLDPKRAREIEAQLRESGVCDKHRTQLADGRPAVQLLLDRHVHPTSMGRSMIDAPELWMAAGSAGVVAGLGLTAHG